MSNPELGKRQERELSGESRFGNKDEVCRWLREGAVEGKTQIEDVIPKLKGRHSNVVELAVLPYYFRIVKEEIPQEYIYKKGEKIYVRGIFKPYLGESAQKKLEFGFDAETHCHKREEMAYLVDSELGFDIVPPTIEKVIDGQVGSIQLFVPPELADWEKDISGLDEESLHESMDYYKIAVLDYILQNPDRKPENYLVSLDGGKCFAIDHGYILPPKGCSEEDILGPRDILRGKMIPEDLVGQLKSFLNRKDKISLRLSQSVVDLAGIIKRTQELIESGRIL
jgi:hypothetical protein